jgi:hypothetical protein
MKTNVVRISRADGAAARTVPAQIIPFPVPARAVVTAPAAPVLPAAPALPAVPAPASRHVVRPSVGVNVVLALILMLACLLWEVMSIPSSALVDAGHTAITSPRASLDLGCATHGLA